MELQLILTEQLARRFSAMVGVIYSSRAVAVKKNIFVIYVYSQRILKGTGAPGRGHSYRNLLANFKCFV